MGRRSADITDFLHDQVYITRNKHTHTHTYKQGRLSSRYCLKSKRAYYRRRKVNPTRSDPFSWKLNLKFVVTKMALKQGIGLFHTTFPLSLTTT